MLNTHVSAVLCNLHKKICALRSVYNLLSHSLAPTPLSICLRVNFDANGESTSALFLSRNLSKRSLKAKEVSVKTRILLRLTAASRNIPFVCGVESNLP